MRRAALAAMVLAAATLSGCSDTGSGTGTVDQSTVNKLTTPAPLPEGATPKGKASKLIAPRSIKDLGNRPKAGG